MTTNSDLVEYVRTLVRGDTAAHDRIETRLDAAGWEGLPRFMNALFFVMVSHRFKPTDNDAEVIRFVADLRADLSDGGPELDTEGAETLIKSIIDPSIDYTIEQEMIGRIQAATIHKILTEADLTDSELDAFLSEAVQLARQSGT